MLHTELNILTLISNFSHFLSSNQSMNMLGDLWRCEDREVVVVEAELVIEVVNFLGYQGEGEEAFLLDD